MYERSKTKIDKYTLEDPAAALESPVSCSRHSTLVELEFESEFSELNEDSRSIMELLFIGDTGTRLDALFCFPSRDWNAVTCILPT